MLTGMYPFRTLEQLLIFVCPEQQILSTSSAYGVFYKPLGLVLEGLMLLESYLFKICCCC